MNLLGIIVDEWIIKYQKIESDLRSDVYQFPFSKLLKMFISQQFNTEKGNKS